MRSAAYALGMNIAVIIPAAGSSRRYAESLRAEGSEADRSKLDEDLGGRPVLQRTVELFTKHPDVSVIIVAGPADPESYEQFKRRHADKLGLLGVQLCEGGKEFRHQTVANALKLVPESCTHVAVHDAARPCAPPEMIERVLEAAQHFPAVIPAIDVSDTIKRIDPDAKVEAPKDPLADILGAASSGPPARAVKETVDRSSLVAVQTPQVFEVSLLKRAYAQKDLASTDDAQLIERLGERVVVVPGEPTNIKITRTVDLRLARAILGVRAPEQRATHKKF
jgi:2-C-methyl-D-erythritol 4-phosphate cytidylyltransferase